MGARQSGVIAGERLANRRKALGLTQSQVATLTNGRIHSTRLSDYERGLIVPRLETQQLLADVLQTAPEVIWDTPATGGEAA